MGISGAKKRGGISLRKRSDGVANAEVMGDKQKERYEVEKRRKTLFNLLDLVVIISFGLTIYSLYVANYVNAGLFMVVGSVPFAYVTIRRILLNKKRKKKKK